MADATAPGFPRSSFTAISSAVCACVSFPTPLPSPTSPGLIRYQAPGTHLGEMLLCPCSVSNVHSFVTVPEHLKYPPPPMHFLGKESELESRDTLPAPLLGGDCEPSLPFAHSSPETSILDLPSVWGSEPGSALCPLQLAAGPSHLSAVT